MSDAGFYTEIGGRGRTTQKHVIDGGSWRRPPGTVKTFSKIDSDTILGRNCHGSELTTGLSTTTIKLHWCIYMTGHYWGCMNRELNLLNLVKS